MGGYPAATRLLLIPAPHSGVLPVEQCSRRETTLGRVAAREEPHPGLGRATFDRALLPGTVTLGTAMTGSRLVHERGWATQVQQVGYLGPGTPHQDTTSRVYRPLPHRHHAVRQRRPCAARRPRAGRPLWAGYRSSQGSQRPLISQESDGFLAV